MDRIEEVKKIRHHLEYCYDEGKFSSDPNYHWSKEKIIEHALEKIYQMFEPGIVNPYKLWKKTFDELMAVNITEAVCEQFADWMGEPTPFNLKADIYYRVQKAQADGIEL